MLESEEGEVFRQTVELVKGDNKIVLLLHRFIDEGAYRLRVRKDRQGALLSGAPEYRKKKSATISSAMNRPGMWSMITNTV